MTWIARSHCGWSIWWIDALVKAEPTPSSPAVWAVHLIVWARCPKPSGSASRCKPFDMERGYALDAEGPSASGTPSAPIASAIERPHGQWLIPPLALNHSGSDHEPSTPLHELPYRLPCGGRPDWSVDRVSEVWNSPSPAHYFGKRA